MGSVAALKCSSAVSVQALELLIYSLVSPCCQPLIPGGFSQKIRTANCYTSIFGRQDNQGIRPCPARTPPPAQGAFWGQGSYLYWALDLTGIKHQTYWFSSDINWAPAERLWSGGHNHPLAGHQLLVFVCEADLWVIGVVHLIDHSFLRLLLKTKEWGHDWW